MTATILLPTSREKHPAFGKLPSGYDFKPVGLIG
jgi:hypothetical protein